MGNEHLRSPIQHKLTRHVPADPQLPQPWHLVHDDIQRPLRTPDDKMPPLPKRRQSDVSHGQVHHVLRDSEQERKETSVGDALDPIQHHPLERLSRRRRTKEVDEVPVADV